MEDTETPAEMIFRVSGSTDVKRLASSIAHAIYDDKIVVLRAIGVGAINQACKSIPIAQGFAGPRGYVLNTRIAFFSAKVSADEYSGLSFRVCAA